MLHEFEPRIYPVLFLEIIQLLTRPSYEIKFEKEKIQDYLLMLC